MTYLAEPSQSEVPSTGERLAEIAERIGKTVAGPAAWEVDRDARFPAEAIAALKEEQVLSCIVPVEQGGIGATITDVSNMIRILGHHCAATGLILAMHMELMFMLLKFGNTAALRGMVDEIVEGQLLISNAISEVGLGGDVTRSFAAMEPDGDGWHFDKQVLAASYASDAELIVSTARRAPDAEETDQVMALLRAENLELEQTTGWDTLGLRGTGSSGVHIVGHVTADDLFPVPFGAAANGGGQLRHVLITAVWTGLAEAAMNEAHKSVRAAARREIGTTPQSAMRLAELLAEVQVARSALAEAQRQIEAAIASDTMDDIGLVTSLRNVKVITTTTAVRVAGMALQICGINGFRRGEDHPLERILRDAYGGLVMVGNDRYLQQNAKMLPVRRAI